MQYNFIEIGTSNFETLIQTVDDNQVGISIEPLKHYLDQLPDRENVKKVQAAITHQPDEDMIDIYHIPVHVIKKHNLPKWLRGCNTIGDYHWRHKDFNITSLVKIEKVPLISVSTILEQYNVTGVDLVKIDTEGHDVTIMKGFYDELQKGAVDVNKFVFESNNNSDPAEVDEVVGMFNSIGYKGARKFPDTILVKPHSQLNQKNKNEELYKNTHIRSNESATTPKSAGI